MEPWICPRCGIVWAGWVARCTCSPNNTFTTNNTGIGGTWVIPECEHEYATDTRGIYCIKCGKVFAPINNVVICEADEYDKE